MISAWCLPRIIGRAAGGRGLTPGPGALAGPTPRAAPPGTNASAAAPAHPLTDRFGATLAGSLASGEPPAAVSGRCPGRTGGSVLRRPETSPGRSRAEGEVRTAPHRTHPLRLLRQCRLWQSSRLSRIAVRVRSFPAVCAVRSSRDRGGRGPVRRGTGRRVSRACRLLGFS